MKQSEFVRISEYSIRIGSRNKLQLI